MAEAGRIKSTRRTRRRSAVQGRNQDNQTRRLIAPSPTFGHTSSTFATIRLRTYRTKGCLSRKTAMAMVFKLCQCAQRKWRKLDGSNHLAEIIRGVKFVDGERQDRAAA